MIPTITTKFGERGRYHTVSVGKQRLHIDDSQLAQLVAAADPILRNLTPVGSDRGIRT
ncbi:Uncharacterised protein [Mycobacteroides abscessus subsp. abscessus]|nr:hypothetical protein MMCCUG48898_3757 [Mycobacteroides abscessus subsp. massiliense CCUG 48898 = JCM 15300]CPW39442.1 Uncharacterised protein [Mycobacteroides abscessus]SHY43609.1 Uncharacterised protein [Mycobacteroides abscessus subsp. abscessus]CPZ76435.1 Uncharacterised protein [Mycobacteroides abscessus]SID62232.1 Uncharacterised protein [Mycobacteroides abscessus subsp. abscessus]